MPRKIGRFRVLSCVGAGASGIVYRANDPHLHRELAVKLLRPDRLANVEQAAARLRDEARSTARLSHPNVVTVYDVGEHKGSVYVAMEYVDGPSLATWLRTSPRPWREATRMLFQAGLGLAAAHEAALVHRDFKPANVLVGRGFAKVADFGLAMNLTVSAASVTPDAAASGTDTPSMTETWVGEVPHHIAGEAHATGFMGTPAYMAPEVLAGHPPTTQSDQFSFAVALYEALFGTRPFVGETLPELIRSIGIGEMVALPPRAHVPRWLTDITLRGLAPNPADRYPSMKRLLAAIAFTSSVMG